MCQHETEALERLLLDRQRVAELVLGQQAALDQDAAEAVLEAVAERVGTDDLAVEERHRHRVVLRAQREHAGLPLQPDELEDVGEAEVLQRSFECHLTQSLSAGAPAGP